MISKINGELVQVRASGLGDLIKIVALQFKEHVQILEQMYHEEGKILNEDEIDKKYPQIKSTGIIAQVFSAMIIEAFYFDYYQGKRSKSKAELWSKKYSPIQQFECLSENFLSIDKSNETDLHIKLCLLGKVRIHWVHNKSAPLGNYNKKNLTYFNADQCIQLLRELFYYFYEHDNTCETANLTYKSLTDLQKEYKGFSGKN